MESSSKIDIPDVANHSFFLFIDFHLHRKSTEELEERNLTNMAWGTLCLSTWRRTCYTL